MQDLIVEIGRLSADDQTDDKFKLEDKTRRVAQTMFDLTAPKRLEAAKAAFCTQKEITAADVHEHGNDREKQKLREIINREQTFIHSTNPERIIAETNSLRGIRFQILVRLPDYLVSTFEYQVERRVTMNDQAQAKQLIDHGRRLIQTQSWDDLRQVTGSLRRRRAGFRSSHEAAALGHERSEIATPIVPQRHLLAVDQRQITGQAADHLAEFSTPTSLASTAPS